VVNPPDLTFRGFYHQEGARFVVDGSHLAQLELHSTFVGSSKDRLDPVEKLYYSMNYYLICICCAEENLVTKTGTIVSVNLVRIKFQ